MTIKQAYKKAYGILRKIRNEDYEYITSLLEELADIANEYPTVMQAALNSLTAKSDVGLYKHINTNNFALRDKIDFWYQWKSGSHFLKFILAYTIHMDMVKQLVARFENQVLYGDNANGL